MANPGDNVQVAEGTYIEQVTITKSLQIDGAGQDRTVIQAPATKTFDANGNNTYVVELTGSTTSVQMMQLTVSGPGANGGGNNCSPNSASLDQGITVERSATLMLQQSAVRNVFDQPQSGCQRGDGISIGSACFSGFTADVGHATLDHVLVDAYQKDGVAVRGVGSTLNMHDSAVNDMPQPQIASNGVEVLSGAVGVIHNDTVTGNECNFASPGCGSDPLTGVGGAGILISVPGAGTQVTNNVVTMNDMGIYTDTGIKMQNNDTSANRDEGMFIDTTTTGGQFTNNTTTGSNDERTPASGYGVYVNTGAHGNTFENDQGFGNGHTDFYDNGNADNANTFKDNKCGTAFPSKTHWACH